MDLFGLVIAIVYVFIISKIHEWVCKATRKDQYFFSLYIFLLPLVLEVTLHFLNLDSFGLSKFLFPFLLFGYFVGFKKYEKSKGIFISLLFSLLYNSTNNFLSVTLSSITGDEFALKYNNYFSLFILILTYLVIKVVVSYFHLEFKYFDKDYLYPFLKKVLFTFIFLHVVSFTSDIVSTIRHLNGFGSILSSIIFVGLLLTFFSMNSHKVQIEKEIDRVYSEVLVKANQKLRSDKYTYFDLNNIEDSALRSLIAQSIVNAKTNDVEYTLEVKDIITPLSMELLDLVRVMSVLLNNAVEGAVESYQKQLEVAIIKLDLETLVVIQNSCKKRKVKSEDLFELGFSTKGRHRGLGLNNVKEILGKYDNVILETEIDNDVFKQVIRFKRELI